MWRFIQTLFRRKKVFLLPVAIVPVLALLFMAFSAPQYRTEATAWVESSPLLISETAGRPSSSDIEANAREAQRLNEMLSTEPFRMDILERAHLIELAERGQWPPRTPMENLVQDVGLTRIMGVRSVLKGFGLVPPETVDEALARARHAAGQSISVSTGGNNLLRISYLGNDRAAGAPLIQATIDVYKERLSQIQADDIQTSIKFLSEELSLREQRQREASGALQAYLRAHPAPPTGAPRPADEAARIAELEQAFRIEQALYEDLVRTLERVKLEGGAGNAGQQQRISIVDPAGAASSAGFGIKSAILVVLTGAVIGAMFGGAAVLWLTWMDSKVRSREDVMEVAHAPIHVQVPQAPGDSRRWPHVGQMLARDL